MSSTSTALGDRNPEMETPYTACVCRNDLCQCAIEALRDKGMQALLRASQEDVSDKRLRFVPRESVINEIRPDYISKVLQRVDNAEHDIADFLEQATNRVIPRGDCSCTDSMCTGRRVIFASLLFAGLHHILAQFLHADNPGSCDNSLWKLGEAKAEFGDEEPIFHQVQQQTEAQKDLFIHWTYQLRALCFQPIGDNGKVTKLGVEDGLEDRIRLPWTSIEKASSAPIEQATQGSSKPQFIGEKTTNNSFALKTFFGSDPESSREDFDTELRTNNSVPSSSRILSLLAAFEHRGTFYLLFPWAEFGDLRRIWREYSPHPDGTIGQHATWYSPQWLVRECAGMADAVADIHGRREPMLRSHCLLHADIKPDNILGFSHQGSVSLKLADFGHSHILETTSSQVMVETMVNPRSYRAPEYDTETAVTTKYDVWSLGCLFLDFVTWALLGWEEVVSFQQQRLGEVNDPKADYGNSSEDTFFKRVAGSRSPHTWSKFHPSYKPTTPKRSPKSSFMRKHTFSIQGFSRPVVTQVREPVSAHIKRLRDIPQLDAMIRHLLEIIETKMLVSNCDERAWSDEVRDMVTRISQ
ncbi:hypothetical protein PG988_005717 [Apiospora saccharicola]